MTMLQRQSSHDACALRIQDYLERDGERNRSLGSRFIAIAPEDQARWAEAMDATRVANGNDRPMGEKRAVTYQHFVLSPNPDDSLSAEEALDLAEQWAAEMFGGWMEPGRLGSYECAMVAHDDNDNGVTHVHVIVNTTDLETGKRLQVSNKDNDLLWDRLQEISEERGLSRFDTAKEHRAQKKHIESARRKVHSQGRYLTKAERAIAKDGGYSWKQELANKCKVARRTSKSAEEFVDAMEAMGVAVEDCMNAAGEPDFIYSHPANPTRWRTSGYRLGQAYSKSGIERGIADDAYNRLLRDAQMRRNVIRHVMSTFEESLEHVALVSHATTVKEAAATLSVNDELGIRSMGDYDRVLSTLWGRIEMDRARGEDPSSHERQAARVEAARRVAAEGEFFDGVKATPRPKRHRASSDGSRGAGGGAGRREGASGAARTRTQGARSGSGSLGAPQAPPKERPRGNAR